VFNNPTYEQFDTIITNATIIDGSGGAGYIGDVGIRGDRIAAVRRMDPRNPLKSLENSAGRNTRVIDATGLVLCPGFIDIIGMSHFWPTSTKSDHNSLGQSVENVLFGDGKLTSKVMQGITSEVRLPLLLSVRL